MIQILKSKKHGNGPAPCYFTFNYMYVIFPCVNSRLDCCNSILLGFVRNLSEEITLCGKHYSKVAIGDINTKQAFKYFVHVIFHILDLLQNNVKFVSCC